MTTVRERKLTRAKITKAGVPGLHEPYAQLGDGRIMPMGWSLGKTFEIGDTGIAEYISTGSASLWRFTPMAETDQATRIEADRQDVEREGIGGR